MTKIGIKEYISALTFLSGIAIAIYGYGVKNANKANNTSDLIETVKTLDKTVKDQGLMITHFDSTLTVHLVSTKLQENNFRSLIQNYSNFVQANTKSVQEWKEFMQGLTFEVVQEEPMKSVFPSPKIKIMPIK
jgi:hypothetical protein